MATSFRRAATPILPATVIVLLVIASAGPSWAAHRHRVDCNQAMSLLNSGKKPKEVALEMGISVSSVRRCRKKARAAASSPGPALAAPAASRKITP